ncbi:hypothetical protein SynBIOSE41_01120 [Synechococcus sp. BIOS-E4-1]|nr:hypothetical protein SynBIOSE41_01120 [Synechococcus sp. BIOS-E4-1]
MEVMLCCNGLIICRTHRDTADGNDMHLKFFQAVHRSYRRSQVIKSPALGGAAGMVHWIGRLGFELND